MATVLDLNKPSTYREYFIGIDEFNHPKVYTDQHATFVLLIRLILLEPGTYPNHPDMGVGLVSRFRYSMDVDMGKLSNTIKEQIMTYLPQFTLTDVRCVLGDDETGDKKVIRIYITSEELNAYLPINTETGEVLQKTASLADFK